MTIHIHMDVIDFACGGMLSAGFCTAVLAAVAALLADALAWLAAVEAVDAAAAVGLAP